MSFLEDETTEGTEEEDDDEGDNIYKNSCLTLTKLTFAQSTLSVSATVINKTGADVTFHDGLGLYDDKNKFVKIVSQDMFPYKAGQSRTNKWTLEIADVDDGTYRIYPVSKLENGDGIWHFDKCGSTTAFIGLTIEEGVAKLSDGPAIVYNSFELDMSKPLYKRAPREFKVSITNNMMEKYSRQLYLYEDNVAFDFKMARLPQNSTTDVIFTYYPTEKGAHQLRLTKNPYTTAPKAADILFQDTVVAKDIATYNLQFSYEIANFDKSSQKLYGNSFRIKFTVKNIGTIDYDDYIRPLLRHSNWYATTKIFAHIPVGETRVYEFSADGLFYGSTYPFSLYWRKKTSEHMNQFASSAFSFNIAIQRGLAYWTADGKMHAKAISTEPYVTPEDAVAVSFFGVASSKAPTKVTPNSNPNTLYYMPKKYASLAGHNQFVERIVGGSIVDVVADSIRFYDGYSTFIPFNNVNSVVNHISYTRTFDKGFNGLRNENNWSTLVLPFDVQKVTADGVAVDWFKPSDKKDKNFWVRRFYGEEGFYAYFTNAESIKANVPYIITVPGDYKGEEYSLVGKTMVFSADSVILLNKKVAADTDNYNFQGSYSECDTYGDYVYLLDEEVGGNNFIYNEAGGTVAPFRAYFTSETDPNQSSILYVASYIDVFEEPTAILKPTISENDGTDTYLLRQGVYNITGRKIQDVKGRTVEEILRQLPQGIYIINGKKFTK